jgi:hypothetical protein
VHLPVHDAQHALVLVLQQAEKVGQVNLKMLQLKQFMDARNNC